MYASNAKVVWDDLFERFNKVDGSRTFNLHKEIATLSQGTSSVSVYYSKLKGLWEEFEALVPVPGCSCEGSKEYGVHLQSLKLFQFLIGLNDSYLQARSQILMLKPVPSVNQTYSMILSDESQRSVATNAGVLGTGPAKIKPPNQNQLESCTLTREQYNQVLQLLDKKSEVPHCVNASISKVDNPKKVHLPNGDKALVTHLGSSILDGTNKVSGELFSEKVKMIGREDEGLYILANKIDKKDVVLSARHSELSDKHIVQIDVQLLHKRLGHSSSSVLKKLLNLSLADITKSISNCTICPCAKQARSPFPISTSNSLNNFDLLHMDAWGPYKRSTFDGFK
ncbi:uncharacterized protein LOC125859091 [Solanum stenotomum]|uniref:uncharacterized protein LOC125859091 n=1 Tax=Solanum stenotomum TaxID=172797 RepID=UPI0020D1500A|nr:uncharacterized protein LOC125859091 [Solanum stenotomum]